MPRGQIVVTVLVAALVSAATSVAVTRWMRPPTFSPAELVGRQQAPAANIEISQTQTATEIFVECSPLIAKSCAKDSGDFIALAECLEKLRFEGDEGCQSKVQRINSIVIPCRDELRRFCGNVGLGGGRMHKCLLEHKAELSDKCRRANGLP